MAGAAAAQSSMTSMQAVRIRDISFFREAGWAMPTVIIMTVWKNFGYTMSILIVGIQGISRDYYEAARMDGANKVDEFFYITIPQLMQSLGFCIITNLIETYRRK